MHVLQKHREPSQDTTMSTLVSHGSKAVPIPQETQLAKELAANGLARQHNLINNRVDYVKAEDSL